MKLLLPTVFSFIFITLRVKPAVALFALVALTAPLHGQTASQWQQEAVRMYPELAVRGSRFNEMFLAENNRLKTGEPDFFKNPRWPLLLAQRCAAALKPTAIPGLDAPATVSSPPPQAPVEDMKQTSAKLNTITFPQINFKDATIQETVDYLIAESKKLDPRGKGVEVELTPFAKERTQQVRLTLALRKIPMLEAIKYVTNLANLKFKISPGKVTLAAQDEATLVLFTKQWNKIPPGFFDADDKKTGYRKVFENNGVTFPPGSEVTYNAMAQKLVIKNTEDQLDLIERIIGIYFQAVGRPK